MKLLLLSKIDLEEKEVIIKHLLQYPETVLISSRKINIVLH